MIDFILNYEEILKLVNIGNLFKDHFKKRSMPKFLFI